MTRSPLPPVIRIATALIFNPEGETLLVRKEGSHIFMQAGGKIDAQETAVHALIRELYEELGLALSMEEAEYLGSFSAEAAHEPGHLIQADVFRVLVSTPVSAQAEIEELLWVSPLEAPTDCLAPLTRDILMPLAVKLLQGGCARL
ncbi:NUDIX domain-containing protein [Acetobacter farinalis]|uniref:8-oxo-dGTP diphosphatase n=1 Tax=Acetobacter farinalis TaxID=1260984 RepID=A0ABT3Q7T4_9PROT|nr:NUDIX domain-containing protein [Acetobacter farinalis]MCX2561339.1 NUDIX domain-containing protein [Acetobacter farinalis]NHO30452.1 NUDIX domain-containing protein [Acetobacter farinalis]